MFPIYIAYKQRIQIAKNALLLLSALNVKKTVIFILAIVKLNVQKVEKFSLIIEK